MDPGAATLRFNPSQEWQATRRQLSKLATPGAGFKGIFNLKPGQLQPVWNRATKPVPVEQVLKRTDSTPAHCLGDLTSAGDHCLRLLFQLLTPDSEKVVINGEERRH